jgi:hypothetical protein
MGWRSEHTAAPGRRKWHRQRKVWFGSDVHVCVHAEQEKTSTGLVRGSGGGHQPAINFVEQDSVRKREKRRRLGFPVFERGSTPPLGIRRIYMRGLVSKSSLLSICCMKEAGDPERKKKPNAVKKLGPIQPSS